MKNILIVDDEETLLLIMVGRFEEYNDQLRVFTARNGKEAVAMLDSENIDLVVTDLKMPEMDGIELLAYMSHKHPAVPAIAVSAYCTPQIQKKLKSLGALRVMDKPVDFDLLIQEVLKGLEGGENRGSLSGFSVSSFLQILQMEEKTCTLEIHGPGKKHGYLYVVEGELSDAQIGERRGQDAAYEIIAWDRVHFFLKELPRNRRERRIQKSMMSVVMEALRRKDEADEDAGAGAAVADSGATGTAELENEEDIYSGQDGSFALELDEVLGLVDEPPPKEDVRASARDSAAGAKPPKKPTALPKAAARKGKAAVATAGASGGRFEPVVFHSVVSRCREKELLETWLQSADKKLKIQVALQVSRFSKRNGQLRIDQTLIGGDSKLKNGAFYEGNGPLLDRALQKKAPEFTRLGIDRSAGFEGVLGAELNLEAAFYIPLAEDKTRATFLVLGFASADPVASAPEVLDWLCSLLALNYERNRMLYICTRQREALEIVEKIGLEFGRRRVNMQKLLRNTLEKICGLLNVEAGTLYLRDKGDLKVAVAFNSRGEAIEKYRMKFGYGVAGHVAARGRAAIVNDAKKSSRFFKPLDQRTGSTTRSVLCVPMFTQRWIIGAIELRNKINGSFTVTDEWLLKPIAASLSALLMNEQLKRSKDRRLNLK